MGVTGDLFVVWKGVKVERPVYTIVVGNGRSEKIFI